MGYRFLTFVSFEKESIEHTENMYMYVALFSLDGIEIIENHDCPCERWLVHGTSCIYSVLGVGLLV